MPGTGWPCRDHHVSLGRGPARQESLRRRTPPGAVCCYRRGSRPAVRRGSAGERARGIGKTTMGAETQLRAFVARFSPGIAAIAKAARAKMRKRLPRALEMVYDNYN